MKIIHFLTGPHARGPLRAQAQEWGEKTRDQKPQTKNLSLYTFSLHFLSLSASFPQIV